MRESKFIELLNLYIDGEIAPPDAAELELAIQKNRRYRQIYGQYCRIHRATVLLSESFRKDSKEDFSREPDTEVLIRRSRRHFLRSQLGPAIGGLAAAFAVVFGGYVYLRQSTALRTQSPGAAVAQTAPTASYNSPVSAELASTTVPAVSSPSTDASPDFVSFSAPVNYYNARPSPNGSLMETSYNPAALRAQMAMHNALAQRAWPVEQERLWSPPVMALYPSAENPDSNQNRFYSTTANYHSPKLQTVSFDFQK